MRLELAYMPATFPMTSRLPASECPIALETRLTVLSLNLARKDE